MPDQLLTLAVGLVVILTCGVATMLAVRGREG